MRLLVRYLAQTVVMMSLGGLLVLVTLDTFMAFVDELRDLSPAHYQLWEAAVYILLTIPGRLFDLFPTAVLIGSLMGLGALAGHQELMAMRAAGLSVAQILSAVLLGGALLALVAVAVGEGLAPLSEQRAETFRTLAQSEGTAYRGKTDLWARDGGRFVHAEVVLPNRELLGVEVFELSADLRLHAMVRASRASPEANGWRLTEVQRSEIDGQRIQVRVQQQAVEYWPELIPVATLAAISVEPRDMAAANLYRYIGYLERNGLSAEIYRLAFWSRIATPLSSLVMLLLAIPFVFGPLRSVGVGQRLFVGVLVGLVFYIFNRGLSHLSLIYGIAPALSAFAPLLLFTAIGLIALRQVR